MWLLKLDLSECKSGKVDVLVAFLNRSWPFEKEIVRHDQLMEETVLERRENLFPINVSSLFKHPRRLYNIEKPTVIIHGGIY